MSNTIGSLRKKINGAADLQSVVRTMKTVAASSIGQYEKSVSALTEYYHTIELGLGVCFRENGSVTQVKEQKTKKTEGTIGAIVFGSDQGLVGQFNDDITEYAVRKLRALTTKPVVWAVGERVHSRLAESGLSLIGFLAVPNSVRAITPLIGQILIECESQQSQGKVTELHLFYNRPTSGSGYAPVNQRLLPLDETWQQKLKELAWPTGNLPEIMGDCTETLRAKA